MAEPEVKKAHVDSRMVGRFEMYGAIAHGGFASVHLGRSIGAGGFSKLVAIKCLHKQFVADPDVTDMFLDEARVVARVQHPNVVPTIDFVEEDGELFMVMEYVEGVTLGHVLQDLGKNRRKLPFDIVLRVISGTLQGLHAAHEATDERGRDMGIIHRDVSPDNILIGVDGHARLLDFGVARALGRFQSTRDGQVKGKLWYMTPEQVGGKPLSRRTDVFACSVVLWQCLTGRRLFEGEHLGELALKVSQQEIHPPSKFNRAIPAECDKIVMRGLERDPRKRWNTAEDMAEALEGAGKVATPGRVGRWVKMNAKGRLLKRAAKVSAVELTPVEASEISGTHSSGGQESFRAAAEIVVSMTTEEGTQVIESDDMRPQRDESSDTPPTPASSKNAKVSPASSPNLADSARAPFPLASQPGDDDPDGIEQTVEGETLVVEDDEPTIQLAAHMREPKESKPSQPSYPQPLPIAQLSSPMAETALLEEMARTNLLALAAAQRRRRVSLGVAMAAVVLVGVVVFAATAVPVDEPIVTPTPAAEQEPTPAATQEARALPTPAATEPTETAAPEEDSVADGEPEEVEEPEVVEEPEDVEEPEEVEEPAPEPEPEPSAEPPVSKPVSVKPRPTWKPKPSKPKGDDSLLGRH
jgi:serine/threonine protein kinase